MKSFSEALGSVVLAVLLAFCLLLFARESLADESGLVPKDGKVEIVYPVEKTASYRERRRNWSTIFAINVDQILPDKFRSQVNDDSYQDMFGDSTIDLIQAELGMKYNFPLGAIGAGLIVGTGQISDSHGLQDVQDHLSLFKKGATLSFVMDNLFPEPYIAPYVEGQIYSFDWKEKRTTGESKSGSTEFGSAITIGMLIQLNWLDKDSALQAQDSIGLENAYLDLFVTQYNTSEDEKDPNFQTGMNYGAGIRLEF
jgi:hypothetical protein